MIIETVFDYSLYFDIICTFNQKHATSIITVVTPPFDMQDVYIDTFKTKIKISHTYNWYTIHIQYNFR